MIVSKYKYEPGRSTDGYFGDVDSKLSLALPVHPSKRFFRVFDGGRILLFRTQSIINGYDNTIST